MTWSQEQSRTISWAPTSLWFVSLRDRLWVIAGGLLLLTLASSAILLWTARAASASLTLGQNSQAIVQGYGRLAAAMSELEVWSLRSDLLNVPKPELIARAQRHIDMALVPLRQAQNSSYPGPKADFERIEALLPQIISLYASSPTILPSLLETGRSKSEAVVLNEVQKLYEPVIAFDEAINREVLAANRRVEEAAQRTQQLILLQTRFGVASALLAFLTAVLFALLVIRRLDPWFEHLDQGLTALADGDYGYKMRFPGRDELARVSHAFDEMSEKIARQRDALEAANQQLEEKVSVRTAQLEAANEQLSQEDERRRRFLAEAGHELRTPLTAIRGEAQVTLREHEKGGGDPITALERILRQTSLMTRLTDDLFLIARAEAGGLELRKSQFDLSKFTAALFDDFQLITADRGINLSLFVAEEVHIEADSDRMRQVITALIDNAMRHAHNCTRMIGRVLRIGDYAVFTLSDNGQNQSPPNDTLFERFRRGTIQSEGSGLGLSVVRALVEAHHGKVNIQATPENGFEVIVQLPLIAGAAS